MAYTKQTLKELYNTGLSKASLKEGMHTVTLQETELVENEKNEHKNYVRVTMLEKGTDREIYINKFDQGFPVMIAHLKKQLNKENEDIKIPDFLEELINSKTEFNIWVVKYTDPNTQKTNLNINFLKPLEQNPIVVVADEVE